MSTLYELLLRTFVSLVVVTGIVAVWALVAIAAVALWETRT